MFTRLRTWFRWLTTGKDPAREVLLRQLHEDIVFLRSQPFTSARRSTSTQVPDTQK